VSIAGVCLTVVETNGRELSFDVVPESLARTALGGIEAGAAVNVEPSLRVGDQLGGHVVQGHVDAVGRVRFVSPEGDSRRLWVDAPETIVRYCLEKGSIAVDGVSLTVAALDAVNFMATHARGLICLCLTNERCEELGLPPMTQRNEARLGTAFTVSVEAREGVTTGISAADRAHTIQVAIDRDSTPHDLVQPGHVFPLRARDGGVLVRAGQTEAAVDLSR